MTVTLVVPGQLRDLTEGRSTVTVEGTLTTVGDVLQALRARYPGAYDRIVNEERKVRPHVNLFVGTDDIRWSGGLETPVGEGSEVVVLPAVSGG